MVMQRANKILLACGGAAVLGLSYYRWLRSPQLREPRLQEEVWLAALKRHEDYQGEAVKPSTNAYHSSTFRPYWGLQEDLRPGHPTGTIIQEWLGFRISDDGEYVEDMRFLGDAEHRKQCRARFELLAEELRTELEKPFLVAPGDLWSRHWNSMNTHHLKLLDEGLHQLAAVQAEERNFDCASQTLLVAIELATKLQRGGWIDERISGKAMQIASILKFVQLIPVDALAKESWERISSALFHAVPPENELNNFFEDLVVSYRVANRFRPPSRKREGVFSRFDILNLPGIRLREERIFCNLMVDVILAVRAGKRPRYFHPLHEKSGFLVQRPAQYLLDSPTYHILADRRF